MVTALRQRQDAVITLLAGYFLLHVAVRLLLTTSLELDEGQQIYYAQWFAAGYDAQPPLYNWLQYGLIQLLGPGVLALALLKNLMLFATYGLVMAAAREMLRQRDLIIVAALGLLTMPQVSFEAQRDLSHTVALLFAIALLVFAVTQVVKRPALWSYALMGVAIGCGVIAKYNFLLFLVALILALALHPRFRVRLADWRLLLSLAIAAAIITPHAIWFFDHAGHAIAPSMVKMGYGATKGLAEQIGKGLVSVALAVIANIAMPGVLFLIAFGKSLPQAARAGNDWSRLLGTTMVIVLALLVLAVLFGGMANMRDRWLAPAMMVLPLYLCVKLEAGDRLQPDHLKRFLVIALAIMVMVPTILYVRVIAADRFGRYQKQNVPYGQAISQVLAALPVPPAYIVTHDQQMAGNIRLVAPRIPVSLPDNEDLPPPPRFTASRPLLVIWRDDGAPRPDLPEVLDRFLKSYPGLEAKAIGELALPYLFGKPGDRYSFAYGLYAQPDP